MASKYLDLTGLGKVWNKIKTNFVTISTSQTISGQKTISSLNNLLFSADTNALYAVGSYVNSYAYSPLSWNAWHDHFAFLRNHSIQDAQYSTDGSTWSESTANLRKLFIHREASGVTILRASDKAFQFTVYSNGSFHACQIYWITLGINYVGTFSAFNLLIEYSADKSTWTQGFSGNITTTTTTYFAKVVSLPANQKYIRFTFTKTTNLTTGTVELNSICALTYRKGNQGLGRENAFPYDWDENAAVFPITNGNDLGTTSKRWEVFGTSGDFSGTITAASIARSGGTSSQFLKADGSIDSNTYSTTSHNHDTVYVKLNPGAAEQTIRSSIGSLSKGVINLWRSSGDHYTFLGFSNGTTETALGGIGFKSQSDHNLYRKDASNYYKILDENNYTDCVNTTNFPGLNKIGTITKVGNTSSGDVSVTSAGATIGTSLTTIGTIGGVNIQAKIGSYAAASHSHTKIGYVDSRSTAVTPTDAVGINGVQLDFKTAAIGGLGGSYNGVLTLDMYSDVSGGYPIQLGWNTAVDANNTKDICVRTAKSATEWNTWRALADTELTTTEINTICV